MLVLHRHSQKRYVVVSAARGQPFHKQVASINDRIYTFQGPTPTFVSAFGDSAGCRPAYMLCSAVCMTPKVGCTLVPDYPSLMVVRIL